MTAPDDMSPANSLLAALPRAEMNRILKRCTTVELSFGAVLCQQDEAIRHVYFPLTGIISLVATVTSHRPLEIALIGSEGMLGVTLILGVDRAPLRGAVQGSGLCLRMTAGLFRKSLLDSPSLSRRLPRYLYVLMAQLSQTVICSRFHEVDQRLARWLLMTHDRVHSNHLHLTHAFLADMLGVRRSGITIAAGILQSKGLIDYRRGEIDILDRKGLEAASCECYCAVIDDYAQVLG